MVEQAPNDGDSCVGWNCTEMGGMIVTKVEELTPNGMEDLEEFEREEQAPVDSYVYNEWNKEVGVKMEERAPRDSSSSGSGSSGWNSSSEEEIERGVMEEQAPGGGYSSGEWNDNVGEVVDESMVEEQAPGNRQGLRSLMTPVERVEGEVHDGFEVCGYNLDGVVVVNSGIQPNVEEQFEFGGVVFDSNDGVERWEEEDVERFLGCAIDYDSSSSTEW